MAISYKPINMDADIQSTLSPKALELYEGLRSGIIGGWAVEAYKNPEIQAMLKKYGVTDVPSLSTVIEKRMPRVGVITTEQLKNINPTQLQDLGGLFSGADGAKNRSLISQSTPEGAMMREKYLLNLRAGLERNGVQDVIRKLNEMPQLFTPETIANYTTFAQDPLKYPVDTTRPVGQSGAVLEQPLFGGGTDTGTAPADWKAQLVKAGGIAPSDTSTQKTLQEKIIAVLKNPNAQYNDFSKVIDEGLASGEITKQNNQSSWNLREGIFSAYKQYAGANNLKAWKDSQYDKWRTQRDSQDYGTFIAPQTGKQVVMHTPEDLKNALVLGFKKVKEGSTMPTPEEVAMIQAAGYKGEELQASLDAYNKANPKVQGVQQTYDPKTGKTTYADGRIEQSTAPRELTMTPDQEAAAAAKATIASGTGTMGNRDLNLDPTQRGTVPGNKNILTTQAQNPGSEQTTNQLFQAYHGRPANPEELAYWSGKTVGQLEDTLAKTQIFSGPDADKIRAQMMANGQTYIRNQAELEQLAKAGQVSPETLQSVSQKGGMMFRDINQSTSGSTPGSTTGSSGASIIDGVDTTGWSAEDIASVKTVEKMIADATASGKVINPSIEISADMLQRFNEQAQKELKPYYDQIRNQAQQDIQLAAKRLSEDYSTEERKLSGEFGKALESTQENFARRGLNMSTARTRAESDLATQAKTALANAQQEKQRKMEDVGIAGERTLGSSFFPQIEKLKTGAEPILGRPGQYGFSTSTNSRDLFNPQGGVYGTNQQAQLFAEQSRARELETGVRDLRSEYYPNATTFGTDEGFIGSKNFFA